MTSQERAEKSKYDVTSGFLLQETKDNWKEGLVVKERKKKKRNCLSLSLKNGKNHELSPPCRSGNGMKRRKRQNLG